MLELRVENPVDADTPVVARPGHGPAAGAQPAADALRRPHALRGGRARTGSTACRWSFRPNEPSEVRHDRTHLHRHHRGRRGPGPGRGPGAPGGPPRDPGGGLLRQRLRGREGRHGAQARPDVPGHPDAQAQRLRGARAAGPAPTVVFITAYDQHALKAFEVHAVDYLLKPFNAERFEEALVRAKAALRPGRRPPARSPRRWPPPPAATGPWTAWWCGTAPR